MAGRDQMGPEKLTVTSSYIHLSSARVIGLCHCAQRSSFTMELKLRGYCPLHWSGMSSQPGDLVCPTLVLIYVHICPICFIVSIGNTFLLTAKGSLSSLWPASPNDAHSCLFHPPASPQRWGYKHTNLNSGPHACAASTRTLSLWPNPILLRHWQNDFIYHS